MPKTLYELKNLHKVAALADEFDQLLREAVADCRTRPQISKTREVTITLKVKPDKSDVDRVVVSHHIKGKRPEKKVPDYVMDTTVNNGLKCVPSSPESPDQGEIDFGEE